jgi:hypothetical protein
MFLPTRLFPPVDVDADENHVFLPWEGTSARWTTVLWAQNLCPLHRSCLGGLARAPKFQAQAQ